MARMSDKEIARRLGLQYAQVLKDTPANPAVYQDCKEVIHASLQVMDHYNRIAIAIKSKLPGGKTAEVFS